MKKIALISLGIVLIGCLGVGGAVVYHSMKKKPTPHPLTLAQLAKLQFQLPQITTNTSDGHIVQTQLTIQAENSTTLSDLKSAQNQILNIVNTTIDGDQSAEFLSPGGLNQFKNSLIEQINKILPSKDKVSAIDIDSMIEQ